MTTSQRIEAFLRGRWSANFQQVLVNAVSLTRSAIVIRRRGSGIGRGVGEGGAEGGGVEFVLPAADDKGGDAIVPTRGSTAAQPGVTGDLGLVVEAAGILEEAGGEGAEDGSPDASIAD